MALIREPGLHSKELRRPLRLPEFGVRASKPDELVHDSFHPTEAMGDLEAASHQVYGVFDATLGQGQHPQAAEASRDSLLASGLLTECKGLCEPNPRALE